MKKLLSALLLSILLVQLSAQAPVDGFYKGAGNVELIAGAGAEFSSEFYAGREPIELGRDIYTVSFGVATGITNYLDLYLSAPYVIINDEQSIQDGSAYLKLKVLNKKLGNGNLSVSMAVGYSAPLADYLTERLNALGQQAKTIDLRPIVHYQMENGWFTTAQGAYLARQEVVPNASNFSLKLGRASAKWYYDIWYAHQTSYGGLDYRGNPSPTTFRELGVNYNKVGATVYKPICEKLGAYVSTSYVINGRNISKGTGVFAGLVYAPAK